MNRFSIKSNTSQKDIKLSNAAMYFAPKSLVKIIPNGHFLSFIDALDFKIDTRVRRDKTNLCTYSNLHWDLSLLQHPLSVCQTLFSSLPFFQFVLMSPKRLLYVGFFYPNRTCILSLIIPCVQNRIE